MMIGGSLAISCQQQSADNFNYADEKFADIQMLRYKVAGFDQLTLDQKKLIYYLHEAALVGRDILWDQNGRYNLRIRKLLESVYTSDVLTDKNSDNRKAFEEYTKQVWFSNGIHHHYGSTKFQPQFTEEWLREQLDAIDYKEELPEGTAILENAPETWEELMPVIFNPEILPMRVNQKDGDDLILTSASNYYGVDVTQSEAEEFYENMRDPKDSEPIMYGLNSRLVKEGGKLVEKKWTTDGLYGPALQKIVYWLEQAKPYADTDQQKIVIDKLIEYYQTGNLKTFDEYCIEWVKDTEGLVDFTNGFTEVYGDPLGLKASWEAIVNFKDLKATERTKKLSANAQWFEDNSPVDPRFKKEECKGISAKVITAAILAGDLYPSTAIGINLPNSNWIRKEYGSKSVTIGNLTDAYNKAARGSGFGKEFIIDQKTRDLIEKYGDACDDLHTDLHECLGHGSGRLLPGVSDDSLRAYGSTIEEGRADLFALYYLADPKMVELGLVPDQEAYKSNYYTYMMNGLMTQLVRIKPGHNIEEAHMRNRSWIAHWTYENGKEANVIELVKNNGKTYVKINDYEALRSLLGQLLAEVQRIKSEGDFQAARELVEKYGVKIDPELHEEVLARYATLNISPYKGFINPVYSLEKDTDGNITDVKISYDEKYDAQMLRYSRDYATLPLIN